MKSSGKGGPLACALMVLSVCGMSAKTADAAGFAIKEQSGSALGNAFAGATSGVGDISHMFFNAASLTYHKGSKTVLSATASYIIVDSKFKNGTATTAVPSAITTNAAFEGNDDIGKDALVPATYSMLSLNDKLKLGVGITAPFGLATKNPDGWIGRYHALKSQLKTFDINPAVAYRALPWLSVGAGFRLVRAEATLTSAIDFGTIAASEGIGGSNPANQDGAVKLEGDNWGYGWNIGFMVEPVNKVRVGLAYRSQVDLTLEGDADFIDDNFSRAATLRAGSGAFADTGLKTEVTLPDTLSVGITYDATDQLSVMAEAAWTRWSHLDELRIKFDNPNQPDNVTVEEWKDSWFFAVGATYRDAFMKGLSLRLGVAYDQTPVPDRTRTPRVPGADRYWVAIGAGYSPVKWLDLNFGYTHIFLEDADINLTTADSNNRSRGNLSGTYEASIDIIALQGTLRF